MSGVTASLAVYQTQTSLSEESGILGERIPRGAKWAGADPWLPRKFTDAALLSATATHCSAVSAGLELRSTHSGKAEMQPGSVSTQGWCLQSPRSALQPPPHYQHLLFTQDRALQWTKTLANLLQEAAELWARRWNKSPN